MMRMMMMMMMMIMRMRMRMRMMELDRFSSRTPAYMRRVEQYAPFRAHARRALMRRAHPPPRPHPASSPAPPTTSHVRRSITGSSRTSR